MTWNLLRAESLKLRKSGIWLLAVICPLFATFGGALSATKVADNSWITPLFGMVQIYSILLLPLFAGVMTAFVCRYEHQDGGWKQLLTLPISRSSLYIVKGAIVITVLALSQLIFLVGWYVIGTVKGFSDSFPWEIGFRSIIGGWFACFPIVALQLWVSTAWASFAAPLALNVIFTLPNMLVANSKMFGPWYPWAQPFLAMLPKVDSEYSFFYLPYETLLFTIGVSFLFFLCFGLLYFRRKSV